MGRLSSLIWQGLTHGADADERPGKASLPEVLFHLVSDIAEIRVPVSSRYQQVGYIGCQRLFPSNK